MREMGFEATCCDVESFDAAPFDVVSMADALEHMPFPKRALQAAHRLLAEGGHLFLSMPNLDCFGWKARDHLNANPYWSELEHLHNFGRRRLYALLDECGFEPRSYAVNERYFVGMEVISAKRRACVDLPLRRLPRAEQSGPRAVNRRGPPAVSRAGG